MTYDVSVASDGTVTISLAGELDIETVPALDVALAPTMAGLPQAVVVDVGALEFADSSAIALLVRWASLARRLELRDPRPFLQDRIVRLGLTHRVVMGPAPDLPAPEPA